MEQSFRNRLQVNLTDGKDLLIGPSPNSVHAKQVPPHAFETRREARLLTSDKAQLRHGPVGLALLLEARFEPAEVALRGKPDAASDEDG